MSLFKRWFGKLPSSHPDSPREPAETERELPQVPPAATSPGPTVPPGHKVEVIPVPDTLDPSLCPLGDSVWVASLGLGGDEPVEDLEGLLRKLERQAWDAQRPARVSRAEGPLSLLFAPSNPPVKTVPRLLLWVINKPTLDGWLVEPARLQVLLRHLYRLENAAQPITQFVYFEHDCGPGAAVMARLLAGLGLNPQVLQQDPDPQRPLLVKVHRPDGLALIALTGAPFPLQGAVDTFPADVNAQKAGAEAQGDAPLLQMLEARERDYLARVLQPLQPLLSQLNRGPPLRAPRLCRLLRTVVERRAPSDRLALEEALLSRAQPLLILMKPDSRETFVAEFPETGPALRVYPDVQSLRMTVRDLKLPEGSYRIAGLAVRDVFDWGAKSNLTVALNVYLTPYMPTYVFWSPDEARWMAQGQPASAAPPAPPSPPSGLRPLPAPSDALIAAHLAIPGAGDKLTPGQLNTLLTETDIYVEHGLYAKAFEHLRFIFSVDPENLDAHEKAYRIYAAQGNTREASGQLLNVLRLCTRRAEVQRAQPYLALILQQQPQHPEVPLFLAVLRPGGRPFPQA